MSRRVGILRTLAEYYARPRCCASGRRGRARMPAGRAQARPAHSRLRWLRCRRRHSGCGLVVRLRARDRPEIGQAGLDPDIRTSLGLLMLCRLAAVGLCSRASKWSLSRSSMPTRGMRRTLRCTSTSRRVHRSFGIAHPDRTLSNASTCFVRLDASVSRRTASCSPRRRDPSCSTRPDCQREPTYRRSTST